MGPKLIGLSVVSYVKQLVIVSQNYCHHHNTGQAEDTPKGVAEKLRKKPLIPLTTERAFEWILHAIEETVNSRMMHAPSIESNKFMELLFNDPNVKVNPFTKFYLDDFFTVSEVDSMNIDLYNMVAEHVELNTWICWNVLTTNNNKILLVSDRDFRIVEWENLTGFRGSEAHVLELDLSNVMEYLRRTVNRGIGKIQLSQSKKDPLQKVEVAPASLINFTPMIEDAISSLYPRISFVADIHLPKEVKDVLDPTNVDISRLSLIGVESYERFRDEFIMPVIESFGIVHIARRLDDTDKYIATLDNRNVLTIDYADASQWRKAPTEQTELESLAESLLAGDWLPEKDRIRAERFILERNH